MDQEVWDNYKDSTGNASYAIAGPTIELYINSYNKTSELNKISKIDKQAANSNGYIDIISLDKNVKEFNYQIYYHGQSMKFLSPKSSTNEQLFHFRSGGSAIVGFTTNAPEGLRPIVMIPRNKFQYEITE